MEFSHFDEDGNAVMVDVSGKEITQRRALAEGKIRVSREVFEAIAGRKDVYKRQGAGSFCWAAS